MAYSLGRAACCDARSVSEGGCDDSLADASGYIAAMNEFNPNAIGVGDRAKRLPRTPMASR